MTNERLEQILQKALTPMIPREGLNEHLKIRMEEKEMKKENRKGLSMKKIVLATAACCLLVGTVSVASSGNVAYILGSSLLGWDTKNYEGIADLEGKVGFKIRDKESFENGYTFKKANVGDTRDMDENDNVVARYYDIDIDYENQDGQRIHVSAAEAVHIHEERGGVKDTTGIQGIKVNYYEDTYKWVPAGYELTPEDEENLKRDDYYISEGADELSVSTFCSVTWEQEGIWYHMFAYEHIPAKEMFAMAEELITLPGV